MGSNRNDCYMKNINYNCVLSILFISDAVISVGPGKNNTFDYERTVYLCRYSKHIECTSTSNS